MMLAAVAIACATIVALAAIAAWWHTHRPVEIGDDLDGFGSSDVYTAPENTPILRYTVMTLDPEFTVSLGVIDEDGNVTEIPDKRTLH